jgi:hypothetical protein
MQAVATCARPLRLSWKGYQQDRCSGNCFSSLEVRFLLASSKVGGERDSEVTRERVARLDELVAGRGVGGGTGTGPS